MKKILYILVLFPIMVVGQTQTENYTKTTAYKVPTEDGITATDGSGAITDDKKTIQVTYFDGLGKPIQQIANRQSTSGKNIITHIDYDAFGRQVKEYLPYVGSDGTLNYVGGAGTGVEHFYKESTEDETGNPNFEHTDFPFSEKEIDSSPLDRVFKQAAPGIDWRLGSSHEIKLDYQTNAPNEVKYYSATATWNATSNIYDISLVNASGSDYYQENQLYKTITKNENWTSGNNNTTEEFKDKEGRVVLKKTYGVSIVNNVAIDTSHETYYVYDQFGNLTYVIPPLVNGTITVAILNNLCYQYKYDYRNRLVAKKIPSKQWEFIAYDQLDRPVATGPVFTPFGGTETGWIITKYDDFNRVAYTAWMKSPTVYEDDLVKLQDLINKNTQLSEIRRLEKYIGGIPVNYSNLVFPNNLSPLTINYYDNYDFLDVAPLPPSVENQPALTATQVKGLLTGTWVRGLTDNLEQYGGTTTTIYDVKSRPIRTYFKNYYDFPGNPEGYTQVDSSLDFTGKTLKTITTHKRIAADNEIKITERFSYSPQGRLLTHTHQIGTSGAVELIASNTYDELGQLISKKVGGTGTNGLQNVNYNYNIRGWLKGINDTDKLQVNNDAKDLFAFKLNYNDPQPNGGTALYNGNISETFWRTNSDNVLRKYKYTYDNLNRLLEARYNKPGLSNFNSYMEKLSYDKNGNILTLQRNGDMDTNGQTTVNPIDDLTYTYQSNGNKLLKVIDCSNSPQGFKDDGILCIDPSNDYAYDANGNMTKDENKGITAITYNHLNLPTKISFGLSNKIEYIYNAVGQKLKKTVTEQFGTKITTTHYINGFQYKEDVLLFFPHTEGYVNNTVINGVNKYNYVYNYTDHLGNIRLSYTQDPVTPSNLKIMEENHYYPFGLKHTNYNSDQLVYARGITASVVLGRATPNLVNYKYKYNGMEYQDELNLNLYDYGGRNYDPALGRFINIDPLIELMRDNSTYSYGFNNPVYFEDFEGSIPIPQIVRATRTSSGFGIRMHPIKKKLIGHGGLDLVAPTGSDVKSAAIGTVAKIGYDPDGYGNYIVVKHINGYYTLYGHLSGIGSGIKVGGSVGNGESIGRSGNTGGSTGPHLHFEIIKAASLSGVFKNANKINPTSIYDLNETLYPNNKSNNKSTFFNSSFDNPSFDFSSIMNIKIPTIEVPNFGKGPGGARAPLTPLPSIAPSSVVPGPSSQPTPGSTPIPVPAPAPSPLPSIPSFLPNQTRL